MLRYIIIGVLLVCSSVGYATDVQPYDIVLGDVLYVLNVGIEGKSQVEIIPRDGLEHFIQPKTMTVEELQEITVEIPVVPSGLCTLDVIMRKNESKVSTGVMRTYTLRKNVPDIRIETAGNNIKVTVKNKKLGSVQVFVNGVKKAQKEMREGVIEVVQERGQHLVKVVVQEGVVQKEVRIGLPEISIVSLKKDELVLNMEWNIPQNATILFVEDGTERQVQAVLTPKRNIIQRPQGNRMVIRFDSRTVFLDLHEVATPKMQGAAVIDASMRVGDSNWMLSVCLLILLAIGTGFAVRKKESDVDRLARALARIKRKYEK